MADAAVVDFDDCYVTAETHRVEDVASAVIDRFVGDSLTSGTTVLRDLADIDTRYQEREDIQDLIDTASYTVLVTGRPGWGFMRDHIAEPLDNLEYDFDDVFLYPGVDRDGIPVIPEQHGYAEYMTGNGIPAYKQSVIEMLSEDYDTITFIDDSERSHEQVAAVSAADIDQYMLNGNGLEPYDR